jgi:hypothetical protein
MTEELKEMLSMAANDIIAKYKSFIEEDFKKLIDGGIPRESITMRVFNHNGYDYDLISCDRILISRRFKYSFEQEYNNHFGKILLHFMLTEI